MKRYEELLDNSIDTEQVQKTIETIFNAIKAKSDLNKNIEISEQNYNILKTDTFFAKNYVEEYGYDFITFYDKVMTDKKYFIKVWHKEV